MQGNAIIILLIPTILFAIDIVGKIGFRVSIESVGADLCMFAVSFNISTIMTGTLSRMFDLLVANPSHQQANTIRLIYELSFIVLLLSLIAWFLSLMLVSESPRFYIIQWLRNNYRMDVFFAFFIGLFVYYLEIALVLLLYSSIS